MKDYHFENGESNDFDQTIRLDDINEKVKNIEQPISSQEDDLGDANAFLNVFESEKLDIEETLETTESEQTMEEEGKQIPKDEELPPEDAVTRQGGTPVLSEQFCEDEINTEQPTGEFDEPEEPFWNKKTIGIVTGGSVAVLLICFLFVKMFFFGSAKEKEPILQEEQLMLVESVLSEGRLLVYDTETGEQQTVTLTENTTLTDEKGLEIGQDVPKLGDLLMIELDQQGVKVISATYSGIEQQTVSGLTVNTAQKRLETEDKTFTYDDHTMFLHGDDVISPDDLEPCDVLTLYGKKDAVWSVKVSEYHGYIRLAHPEAVKNGTFQLDDESAVPLGQVDRLPVSAGKHTVLVTGENIESRKDTIVVTEGEETVYDVSGTQKKMGVLVVNANVSDYRLYINGTLTDTKNPAVLPFGEYDVVILKDGYEQWNKKVSLKEDTVTLSAELEKTEKEGDTYGSVTFRSNVDDTEVWVDGVNMGLTPLQIDLVYGTHHVVFHKEGYTDNTQTVTVESSMTNVNGALS